MKKYRYTGEHRSMACRQLLCHDGIYELDPDDGHVKSLAKAGLLVPADAEPTEPATEPQPKTKKKKK